MSSEDDRLYLQKGVEAAEKLQKAAEQGNADAQYELGLLYLFGKGVPKDREKTAECFRKAAAQGHAEAAIEVNKARREEKDTARKAKLRTIIIAAIAAIILIVVGSIVYNTKKNSVTTHNKTGTELSIPAEKNENPVTAVGGMSLPSNQQSTTTSSNNTQQSQNNFQATHKVVTNDGTNLRLRAAPGFNASQIGSLNYGSSVRLLETGASAVDSDGYRGNWTYVSTPDGKTGWCFGAYLQLLP